MQLLRKSKAQTENNLEKEAKILLDFYAEKFANAKSLSDSYQVGTSENIDEFMSYVQENPILLKVFNNVSGIRTYVEGEFDGLPF